MIELEVFYFYHEDGEKKFLSEEVIEGGVIEDLFEQVYRENESLSIIDQSVEFKEKKAQDKYELWIDSQDFRTRMFFNNEFM